MNQINTEHIERTRWGTWTYKQVVQDSPGGPLVTSPPANAGDLGSILGSGRSPGEGDGNPLQYSCLENPMDRGAWRLQSVGSQSQR